MNRLMRALLETNAGIGNTLLRVVVGIIFTAHGCQKLFGLFGGSGPFAFSDFLKTINVPFPLVSAFLAANAEFFCGIALLLGFLTRLAVFPLMINMWVAIVYVHITHGFFGQNGGFEYPLLLLTIQVYFLISGAGPGSFDHWFSKKINK